jgi:hypothetical protein
MQLRDAADGKMEGAYFYGRATIPEDFAALGPGTWTFLQLIDSHQHTRTTWEGTNQRESRDGLAGLDGFPSYLDQPVRFVGEQGDTTTDSPGHLFEPEAVHYQAATTFSMYLVFKPIGTTSRWVPLRKLTWGYSAEASNDPAFGQWTLLPAPAPFPAAGTSGAVENTPPAWGFVFRPQEPYQWINL